MALNWKSTCLLLCLSSGISAQQFTIGNFDGTVGSYWGKLECPSGSYIKDIGLRSTSATSFLWTGTVTFVQTLQIRCSDSEATEASVVNGGTDLRGVSCNKGFKSFQAGYLSTNTPIGPFNNVDGLRFACGRNAKKFKGTPAISDEAVVKKCRKNKRLCSIDVWLNPAGDLRQLKLKCCKGN